MLVDAVPVASPSSDRREDSDFVVLHGLQSAHRLNGRVGRVCGFKGERLSVELSDLELKSVKPANVWPTGRYALGRAVEVIGGEFNGRKGVAT